MTFLYAFAGALILIGAVSLMLHWRRRKPAKPAPLTDAQKAVLTELDATWDAGWATTEIARWWYERRAK